MTFVQSIKAGLRSVRARLLIQHSIELRRLQLRLAALESVQFRNQTQFRRRSGLSIHVVFACHMPALWSMFETIYSSLIQDPRFKVTVVSLPYRHSTLPPGQYKDEGVDAYLRTRGVEVMPGRDTSTGQWLDPLALDPDYLFFQTPYSTFDALWSIERVSTACRICYVPYATDIFQGPIEDIIHPEEFFRYVYFFFKEGPLNKEIFLKRYPKPPEWLIADRVRVSGQPKLDFIASGRQFSDDIWKGGDVTKGRRVLWTPRWNTSEGVCHFFDYKDFFFEYFRRRQGASFVFRPHPLCLQNFVRTGEMTASEQSAFVASYEASSNMLLDRSGNYHDTFMTSDMIVTDLSSMLLEYFATGKPVIYTHRNNRFNQLGNHIAEGCYWVRDQGELETTLDMLMGGQDPLRDRRLEILSKVYHFPPGGAGSEIARALRRDYDETASTIT